MKSKTKTTPMVKQKHKFRRLTSPERFSAVELSLSRITF